MTRINFTGAADLPKNSNELMSLLSTALINGDEVEVVRPLNDDKLYDQLRYLQRRGDIRFITFAKRYVVDKATTQEDLEISYPHDTEQWGRTEQTETIVERNPIMKLFYKLFRTK